MCKANTMLQRYCEESRIQSLTCSSDQSYGIGKSSWEKAFLKKEKRQLKNCFSIFSLIHPSILL